MYKYVHVTFSYFSGKCKDRFSNCPELAATNCHVESTQIACRQSCGLCPGMTPAPSTQCYDKYANCGELAQADCGRVGADCRKSCGLCPGMTPAPSTACPDRLGNCVELAKDTCYQAHYFWTDKNLYRETKMHFETLR
jgi:hypothetical protein